MIPPEQSAEFVWQMEDILDVYTRPLDPRCPLVCLDELPKQLIGEVRQPLPAEPGRPERFDYLYVRNGVANIFCLSEPLLGTREFSVTEHRTREDWARLIKYVVDVRHPDADRIVLVLVSAPMRKNGSPAVCGKADCPEPERPVGLTDNQRTKDADSSLGQAESTRIRSRSNLARP